MTILIADDDRVLVHWLSSHLKARGFNVTVAFDAMQAWMVAVRTPPAAIILDINMPSGRGFEVLRKLKASAKTSQVPVVVLSGSIDWQGAETVRDLGAEEFLPKPVELDLLDGTLPRLLGRPVETLPESTS